MPDRAAPIADCPDTAELLLASEGELPKRRLAAVREHVRRCATCRDRLGDTESAVDAYADDLAGAPASPPEIDASLARSGAFRSALLAEASEPCVKREASSWPAVSTRSWLPVAAAIPIVVIGLIFSSRYTSTLKADELLTRAAVQERAEPKATVHRVEIRFTPGIRSRAASGAGAALRDRGASHEGTASRDGAGHTLIAAATITRDVGDAAFVSAAQAPVPVEQTLAQLFAEHHFDIADPLSVAHFQAWRASLGQKHDAVRLQPDDHFVTLQTTTSEGQLRRAELVVRRADYHPVRQTLTFENIGEVEIMEVATWIGNTPLAAPVLEVPAAPPVKVANAGPDPRVLDDAELEARRVLHQAAADIQPGVTVARTSRSIEVRGAVPAADAALKGRLESISHVLADIRTAAPIAPAATATSTGNTLTAPAAAPDALNGRAAGGVTSSNPSPVGGAVAAGRDVRGTGASGASGFGTPESGASPPAAGETSYRARSGTEVPLVGLSRWRQRTFGGGEAAESFGPELLRAVDQLAARGRALDFLAARYPSREADRFAPETAEKLQALVGDHYRDLVSALELVDGQLALFLGSSSRETLKATTFQDWQTRASSIAAQAEKVRDAVRTLLRKEDIPLPTELHSGRPEPTALTDLRKALDELWVTIGALR